MEKLEYSTVPSFISRDWFISYRFLTVCDLEHLYYMEKPRGVDRVITSAFEMYKQKCKQGLIRNFKHRSILLNEVFKCYESECFSAVVTLAYSTAEGIVNETFGQKFWGGYDRKTKHILFEKLRDEHGIKGFLRMHYKRLSFRGIINQDSEKIKESVDSSNNRHLVLHGQSYKYGNRKNAIKAILLLDFISELAYFQWHNKG